MSPRPSQGILLKWNREEAMTWHTASVTPAGGPSWLRRSSLRSMYVYLCNRKKRSSRCECARVSVCHRARSRVQYASQEYEQRTVTGGEAATVARPPSACKTHRHTQKSRAYKNDHLIHSFSVHLISSTWGLEEGHGRIQKQSPNVLTAITPPHPAVRFVHSHYLQVAKYKWNLEDS